MFSKGTARVCSACIWKRDNYVGYVLQLCAPQVVRFNVGADDPAAAAATTTGGATTSRTLSGGGRARGAGPSPSARAALVRGVSFEHTTFHRSKSAVMHRGSLSGDDATTAASVSSSSAKSSPTRSPRGQGANASPFKERPLAPAVARVQQLQQMPAARSQSSKGSAAAGSDPRATTMAVQLYEPPFARPPISDLSNENYTRFHRIRAVQQQQQAAAISAPGVTARRKEATTSQNLLLRTRSMTTSRSSTNLTQPQQQEGARTSGKPNRDKNASASQDAKGSASPTDAGQRLAAEATPKLRRTSSGPSRRPARTAKEPVPWTSLAVQTAAGVIALLCKPQEGDAASLLPPRPLQAKLGAPPVRETRVPRLVKVSVSDEDSSADREDSASSGPRDSSSSLAQPSS
ncbi:prophage side tail fiber protein homolog StfR-like [Dermacentor albipictus]|uniref:prophage side tail fiber protein homolog StfR-like n=1 Tax=Dermacentor albipictus TaxID=60249 RepID=UPI0038FC085B